MSKALNRADLPRLEEYPIPQNVRPDRFWGETMREMADHIGAYDTLRIIAAYGGQFVYIPRDPALSPFLDLIGPDQAAALAWVYGREKLLLPAGTTAVARARRQAVVAQVKAGQLKPREAHLIAGVTLKYFYEMMHREEEQGGELPALAPRNPRDTRQMSIFDVLGDGSQP